jgi:aspartokinase-like uncharacterized kinase
LPCGSPTTGEAIEVEIGMSPDAVLKIGGSLGRCAELPDLCRMIEKLSRNHSLVIIPGGGDFAEQVREADRRFQLGDTTAHWMAVLAMDQYGYLLSRLISGSVVTPALDNALKSSESGRPAILLPSALMMKSDPLPHSWQVTSDSIAAWVSQTIYCPRLGLLKDVDGLVNEEGLIPEMTVAQLAAHSGGTDEYLPKLLAHATPETWVINGRRPERLAEWLVTGHTTGTRIW